MIDFSTLRVMKFEYPAKIILAWGEAITGNRDLRDWLIKNEYAELGLFVHALHNQDSARQWLLDNGFPHLLALINGSEGNESALAWLKKFDFEIMEKMARGADNDNDALIWLVSNGYPDMATIAQKIRFVKNEIERDNNDVHKISSS